MTFSRIRRCLPWPALLGLACLLAAACGGSSGQQQASGPPVPRLLFGLGPEGPEAAASQLDAEAPLGMYTNWYNGPADLTWIGGWKDVVVPQIYASGRALHLVVYSPDPPTGTPCGRQYPISSRINGDMVELARVFAGKADGPPLYVTLFTEFQTYPCVTNQWRGAEDYYTLLQQKMLEIKDVFHQYAPNSRVSIGWGGWQDRWDDPGAGGGRSLFAHFDSVMSQMDFQSFQAMQTDSNVNDVRAMTKTLGVYGPVMMAHYKPDNGSIPVYHADTGAIMNDSFLREITGYGLFAWSFMNSNEMSGDPSLFDQVKEAVLRYGRPPQPTTPASPQTAP